MDSLADILRAALMGQSAGGLLGNVTSAPYTGGIMPRSALDTSGMGAMTPPDTWAGRAQEAAANPDIRATTDLAMGMVGPGSIKGIGPTSVESHLANLRNFQSNNSQFDNAIQALANDKSIRALEMRQIATDFLGREPRASKGRSDLLQDITDRQALDARQEARMRTINNQYTPSVETPGGVLGGGPAASSNLPAQIATEFAGAPGRVMLADVRAAFPEVPPAQLHSTLRQMQQDGQLNLMRIDNPVELTARDHAAAMQIGNEPRHMFRWVTGGK